MSCKWQYTMQGWIQQEGVQWCSYTLFDSCYTYILKPGTQESQPHFYLGSAEGVNCLIFNVPDTC